jgi:hypothetical protein
MVTAFGILAKKNEMQRFWIAEGLLLRKQPLSEMRERGTKASNDWALSVDKNISLSVPGADATW